LAEAVSDLSANTLLFHKKFVVLKTMIQTLPHHKGILTYYQGYNIKLILILYNPYMSIQQGIYNPYVLLHDFTCIVSANALRPTEAQLRFAPDWSPGKCAKKSVKIKGFPKMVVPQNGWFIVGNPILKNDLGMPKY
jgi:hypothetical protein